MDEDEAFLYGDSAAADEGKAVSVQPEGVLCQRSTELGFACWVRTDSLAFILFLAPPQKLETER
jgi:hypothetical protein